MIREMISHFQYLGNHKLKVSFLQKCLTLNLKQRKAYTTSKCSAMSIIIVDIFNYLGNLTILSKSLSALSLKNL